jgi:hypothetical protein
MGRRIVDLTNKQFGKLTVIARDLREQKIKNPRTAWFCRCECGNEISVIGNELQKGVKLHCGCQKRASGKKVSKKLDDLTGKRFGKLTVLYRDIEAEIEKKAIKPIWKCQCECGKLVSVRAYSLKAGKTISCGCVRKENAKKVLMHYMNNRPESEKSKLMKQINEEQSNEYKLIPLSDKIFAKVDSGDYEYLKNHTWRIDGAGYASTSIFEDGKWKNVLMQNMIMNPPDGYCVNFIIRDDHDYRRSNLRVASRQQIVFSRKVSRNKKYSKYKGVSMRRGKWIAAINKDGKRYNLGTFKNEIDAAKAYNAKALELFGEFAWLNEIE